MRKILFVVIIAALASPLAAFAVGSSATEGPSAAQACKTERTAIGASAFKDLYGTIASKSNAFGKCVAQKARARQKNHDGAVAACRAEQADTSFATSHGGKTFDQFYGTGKGKNAFGKCVSGKAKASNQADDKTTINAAKLCKSERAANPAAFKTKYGTNRNKSNAFGKCVSQKAKANSQ